MLKFSNREGLWTGFFPAAVPFLSLRRQYGKISSRRRHYLLKFDGVDTMNEVEGWRQKDLLITRDQAIPLEEDEFFITDLIGLNVVTDEGETLGTLTDVMETGANDVYCVKTPEGKELLLPAIRDCILDVDLDKEEMLVHVLPGLLDL